MKLILPLLLLCPFLAAAQPKKLSIFSRSTGTTSGNFTLMSEEQKAEGTVTISDSLVTIGKGAFKVDSVSKIILSPLLSYLYYSSLYGEPCTITVTTFDGGGSWSVFFSTDAFAVRYRAKELLEP